MTRVAKIRHCSEKLLTHLLTAYHVRFAQGASLHCEKQLARAEASKISSRKLGNIDHHARAPKLAELVISASKFVCPQVNLHHLHRAGRSSSVPREIYCSRCNARHFPHRPRQRVGAWISVATPTNALQSSSQIRSR